MRNSQAHMVLTQYLDLEKIPSGTDLFWPLLFEQVPLGTLDNEIVMDVKKTLYGCSVDQLTVLKKITDDNYSSLGRNLSKLFAAITNDDLIGKETYGLPTGMDRLWRINANKSIVEWFKGDFGDGGRYLSSSCDNIKYLTFYDAGRLIAMQSLRPVAAEEDTCEVAEQEKATDQLLVSAPNWVVTRVNVERGDSNISSMNGDNAMSLTNDESAISSTTSN